MRIWHQDLIPKLCRQHLLAVWREGLGCYAIVTGKVDGGSYRNHPAVKEFDGNSLELFARLTLIRDEMLRRGYHPKDLPEIPEDHIFTSKQFYIPWQTLEEQIEVLKKKGCECRV